MLPKVPEVGFFIGYIFDVANNSGKRSITCVLKMLCTFLAWFFGPRLLGGLEDILAAQARLSRCSEFAQAY